MHRLSMIYYKFWGSHIAPFLCVDQFILATFPEGVYALVLWHSPAHIRLLLATFVDRELRHVASARLETDTLNMSAREDRTARIDNPILEPIVIILILDLLHGAPYV